MYVDDALIACAPTKEGNSLLKQIRGLYEWGSWESKSFVQHKQWGGFTVSMEDYASEI